MKVGDIVQVAPGELDHLSRLGCANADLLALAGVPLEIVELDSLSGKDGAKAIVSDGNRRCPISLNYLEPAHK